MKERCAHLDGFIREAWAVIRADVPYVDNWHIEFICKHLEAITSGEMLARGHENRLLVNVPPGTMKSLLISVFWLAWEWGPAAKPYLQAIATSYKEDATIRDSQLFAKLVTSDWYQQHWGDLVSITRNNDGFVENTRGGHRRSLPYRSLTGFRADRLLIDDPHSVDIVESDVERDKSTLRFRESATSRLNDPVRSAIVVIMQRLHESDISGVILSRKMPYIHICLPMRFEIERRCVTPFGDDRREVDGELLFERRFPKETVDRDEIVMGDHAFAGQYQQRPSPRGGLLFKRHWFVEAPAAPAGIKWVRGWDIAATEKKTSAYTAGVKLGHDMMTGRFYIADCVRERTANPQELITRVAKADGFGVEQSIPQDPGAAGRIVAMSMVGALPGYTVIASPESGDKVARADPVAAQARVGNVTYVKGPWNDDFFAELEKFPTGTYKDQVDALSRAFGRFVVAPGGMVIAPIIVTQPFAHFGENPDARR